MNKVILLGHVGQDPEIKRLSSGDRVANFSIATSDKWRDKDSGERRERTEWHRIVVWNDGLVGVVEAYVRKGKQVYVEGAVKTRKWTDQNGNDRFMTEVVLDTFKGEIVLCGKASDSDSGQRGERATGMTRDEALNDNRPIRPTNPVDDDIPF
jgi:single-strand DNA-binding protein